MGVKLGIVGDSCCDVMYTQAREPVGGQDRSLGVAYHWDPFVLPHEKFPLFTIFVFQLVSLRDSIERYPVIAFELIWICWKRLAASASHLDALRDDSPKAFVL